MRQPQIFQSASWVLGFSHIDQLRSAPPLHESVRPAAIEFLARLQNEVDTFLTSESFNAGLYAFAQREGWGFVDLYFLKHKERGGGSVALQPSTRAALEQRSWFDSILYKALSECCSPRHEGGEVAEVRCGPARPPTHWPRPSHTPNLTPHPASPPQLELDLAFLERHCQLCLADEDACWRASPKTPGPGLCRQLALGPQEKAGSKAKMTWR